MKRAARLMFDRLAWLGGGFSRLTIVERYIAAAFACVAGILFLFVQLAGEVVEGDTTAFDHTVMLALRNPADLSDPVGPVWMEEGMRDITALGGTLVLTLITLLVVVYLVIVRERRTAMFVAVSVAGGSAVGNLLKAGFHRPRPDLVPHDVAVYTLSFPSSHAMMSAIVYLTLGILLARQEGRTALKIYLIAIAVLLTLLVGVSRVYLGVHWPTDVLAGWAIGLAWALMCWVAMLLLQRKRVVELQSARSTWRLGPMNGYRACD